MELALYNPYTDSLFSQELLFIRGQSSKIQPTIFSDNKFIPRTVKEFCENSNASICINANFFDEKNKPLGLVIKNGIEVNPLHKGGTLLNAIFEYSNNKIKIIHRNGYNNKKAEYALQAGPLLLQNGKVYSSFKAGDSESRRSGACIDYQGRLILFCSQGDVTGPSLNKLASILLMPGIKCKDAINFDGGGSAQIYINKKFVNIENNIQKEDFRHYTPGSDPVPVAFALINK